MLISIMTQMTTEPFWDDRIRNGRITIEHAVEYIHRMHGGTEAARLLLTHLRLCFPLDMLLRL